MLLLLLLFLLLLQLTLKSNKITCHCLMKDVITTKVTNRYIGNEKVVRVFLIFFFLFFFLILLSCVLFWDRTKAYGHSEDKKNLLSIFLSSWCNLSLSSVCNSSTLNALYHSLHQNIKERNFFYNYFSL